MPPFPVWIRTAISNAIKDGEEIDKDTLRMSMAPTLARRPYHLIYALRNHIKVWSVEEHLKTVESCVVATFEHDCISRPNDQILVPAKLKYVRWVEEILELNYGILKIVVLLCNWVKVNYRRNSVTMKKNEYDLKLVNFAPLIPILDQFSISPLHVKQVFFSYGSKRKSLENDFMERTPRESCYKKGNYWWVLRVMSSIFINESIQPPTLLGVLLLLLQLWLQMTLMKVQMMTMKVWKVMTLTLPLIKMSIT